MLLQTLLLLVVGPVGTYDAIPQAASLPFATATRELSSESKLLVRRRLMMMLEWLQLEFTIYIFKEVCRLSRSDESER